MEATQAEAGKMLWNPGDGSTQASSGLRLAQPSSVVPGEARFARECHWAIGF